MLIGNSRTKDGEENPLEFGNSSTYAGLATAREDLPVC
jgi:hypothetical protein